MKLYIYWALLQFMSFCLSTVPQIIIYNITDPKNMGSPRTSMSQDLGRFVKSLLLIDLTVVLKAT